ncbi:hypothetical protein DXG03_004078 [Asterophora parasitica]|uniref:Pre-mRNA-splicing factor CWC24 n=1 Tax=Asterophora parasitica TaxID=117018 RepID=A0A9P7GAH6_9AGAR|nr:hypothetical protein DXG03_004078 [Asterophora parasitica]
MASEAPLTVPFFKKKGKGRPTTSRQRSPSPKANVIQPATTKSEVVLPTRKAAGNLLSAGTKRTATQRDEYDDSDAPEKDGPDVKWTASGSHTNAALEILAGDEAEELLAKRRKQNAGSDDEDVPDDGQYRGQSAYKAHLQKSKEVPKAMRVGPQRNTSTIRTVTIVDYQPDVCKDYKDLAGWQLDKLAENASKEVGNDDSDSDSDDEDVPFACLICRKHYTDPIVTRCGHYFCSACAIKRFAKTPKCLACGATTGGMFNRADKIIEKINKKKQDKKDRKEARDEDGPGPDIEIEGLDDKGSDDDSN